MHEHKHCRHWLQFLKYEVVDASENLNVAEVQPLVDEAVVEDDTGITCNPSDNLNCCTTIQTPATRILLIDIRKDTLNDGWWYSIRISRNFPPLFGNEIVIFKMGQQLISLIDRRGKRITANRVIRQGERIRMVYTEDSVGGLPAFLAP